jgi:hypothetical protein
MQPRSCRTARGCVYLALAAVDQDQVGDLAALRAHALVAALEHLAHRRVVVARRDAADVEAAVFGRLHLLAIVDHARGDVASPIGVADIEALDAPGASPGRGASRSASSRLFCVARSAHELAIASSAFMRAMSSPHPALA